MLLSLLACSASGSILSSTPAGNDAAATVADVNTTAFRNALAGASLAAQPLSEAQMRGVMDALKSATVPSGEKAAAATLRSAWKR